MNNLHDFQSELTAIVTATFYNNALEEVTALAPEDFYDERTREVYHALCDMRKRNVKADLMSLRQCLIERGSFEKLGGDDFLGKFAKLSPTYNIDVITNALKGYTKRRRIYDSACDARDKVTDLTRDPDEIIFELDDEIKAIDAAEDASLVVMNEMPVQDISYYCEAGKYISSGFKNIDQMMIGLFGSELTVIGARPSVGKSALASNIIRHVAVDHTALMFSIEMKWFNIQQRMIAAESGVPLTNIRTGELGYDDQFAANAAIQKLQKLNIIYSDKIFSINEIVGKTHKINRRRKVGLVIVDYLQKIKIKSNEQRYIQVAKIAGALKELAMELDAPVIALAQIKRDAENRVPELSDLRESGDIEQDADNILFLHQSKNDSKEIIQLIQAKGRSTGIGRAKMIFKKNIMRFRDLEFRDYGSSDPGFGEGY